MQVQIHQRVKILKKDLWVWSVEGRGGGMGNRVIKAFDHMLNITDACSHPHTHHKC